jgi:hypothetical protein
VRESGTFKKILDFRDDELENSNNSWKIKKIEFSDDHSKLKKKTPTKKKKESKVRTEDNEEDMNISHSSIDRLVFGDNHNDSAK